MNKLQPYYIPFEPLTETLSRNLLADGYRYWVVQRLHWPAISAGTGFIACPYRDEQEAALHQSAIAVKEGKVLDMTQEAAKITSLIRDGSGYRVFLNSFKSEDWKMKMKQQYQKKIMAFIRERTNFFPKGGTVVDINFYPKFGYLYADLEYGDKKLTGVLAIDMIS